MAENQTYSKCQSCGITIKNEASKGTEIDQSLSNKYCKYCYRDGAFIEPTITLEKMQEKCAENFKIEHPFISILFGKMYVKSIAKLARWNQENN